ncbi:unnamed protein product [Sphenostylis stenocarpa]|uniref:Non-haem dioxygenase N-terminal domain-containing protein n=1 Tax=Sphenostylis stenocarpa TaxID=92480 RepID=A0AA86TI60_9FABA|nr:unnamed protein product [Sphenostylis stenocarpa]
MDSTLVLNPASQSSQEPKKENGELDFHTNFLQMKGDMPKEFIWPSGDLVEASQEELKEPLVDLGIMKNGDEETIANSAEIVRNACMKHGFFQVINHGVDPDLIDAAHQEIDTIFNLPMSRKLTAQRKPGGVSGYSGAHADRFSSKLPWKETFSFLFHHQGSSNSEIVDYFESVLGQDFQRTGVVTTAEDVMDRYVSQNGQYLHINYRHHMPIIHRWDPTVAFVNISREGDIG